MPVEPEPAYLDVSIVVAGDAMSHMPQTEDALKCGGGTEYDYTPCLQFVKPRVSAADIGIVNLETVFRQGKEYSGFPCFNTPSSFGYALADAVTITSPEAIFIFGGLAKAGDLIFDPIKWYMEENMLIAFKNKVKVLPSELQNKNAAVLGASALVWQATK